MIAGALATLLASGAYFAADSIKTNANIYRNANRMDDEGVFWPTNPEVERMLQHDIRSLWETGKRDFIPEGLEGFFEENNSARGLYFDAVNANLPERIAYFGGDCRKISADEYWDDRAVVVKAEVSNGVSNV